MFITADVEAEILDLVHEITDAVGAATAPPTDEWAMIREYHAARCSVAILLNHDGSFYVLAQRGEYVVYRTVGDRSTRHEIGRQSAVGALVRRLLDITPMSVTIGDHLRVIP